MAGSAKTRPLISHIAQAFMGRLTGAARAPSLPNTVPCEDLPPHPDRTIDRRHRHSNAPAHREARKALSGLASDRARLGALAGFILLVALTGGASRADVASLVVLRPLAFGFAGYALILASPAQLRAVAAPLAILASFGLLMLLQLVPLPPAWWQSLAGRGEVAAALAQAGVEPVWRPLSLTPGNTLNALFALIVPLAAVLLAAIQPPTHHRLLWQMLVVLAAVSALLGLAQLAGPPAGPLYLYRITNNGSSVGLFANRNHQAMLLAATIPLLAHWAMLQLTRGRALFALLAGLASCLLLPLIALTGSRAGAALAAVALVASAAASLRLAAPALLARRKGKGLRAHLPAVPLALAALASACGASLWSLTQSRAASRLSEQGLGDELRLRVFPYLLDLCEKYAPWGSGFGSFEQVYAIVEPIDLLGPTYLNQAHDDLLQLVIEGGVGASLLLLASLAWLARSGWRLWRHFATDIRDIDARRSRALFAFIALAMLLAGGLLDYPLRTPLGAMFAAILAAMIGFGSDRKARQFAPF